MATRRINRMQRSSAGLHPGGPASALFGYRYPLTVMAIAAPLFVIYSYPYAEGGAMASGMQSYLAGYARLAGAVISILDPQVVVTGNCIVGRLFSMSIVKTCDAMEVNILLGAALAGFPMPLPMRIVTVVTSISTLVLINVLRLCVLYWLGAHVPAWFDRAHQTVAPFFMVASALVIFLFATASRHRAGKPAPQVQVDATS